jgi:UDP-GlcNAc:undecaprenyl-phosphate GlcNAc-1-phosphate transferase
MDLGHGHRRSVVILWTWTLLLSAFVLYPTLSGRNPAYLPFGIVALAIVLFTVLHPSVRARRRETEPPGSEWRPAAARGADAGDEADDGDDVAETLAEGLPPTGSAD